MKPHFHHILTRIDTLAFFESVARHNSFTKAADELHVTQSAASKQVKRLEERLGVQLFNRVNKGVILTSAGYELLETLQPLLHSLESTIIRIQQQHSVKTVSIACTQAVGHYWLSAKLFAFQQTHPDIMVNLVSTNNLTEKNCAAYDFCILYGNGDWLSLQSTKLYDERIYPICSVNFNAPEITDPVQLLQLPIIQLDPSLWHWVTWKDWFTHFGIEYRPTKKILTCSQVTLAVSACASGMGVTLGWDFIARDMIQNSIFKQLGPYVYTTGRSDYLVYPHSRPLSEAAQTFKSWFLENCQEQEIAQDESVFISLS